MKKTGIILCLFVSTLTAQKTKITLYNHSAETILVSIDPKPLRPLMKNSIESMQAKNFFLPFLTSEQPYYFIVESSSELEPKTFMIRKDKHRNQIILERDGLILGSLPSLILNDPNRFIKIVYRGTLRPAIPEVKFMR